MLALSTLTKACSKCGEEKPYSAFQKRKPSRDGLQPFCKMCVAAYERKYAQTKAGKKVRDRAARKYRYSERGRAVGRAAVDKFHSSSRGQEYVKGYNQNLLRDPAAKAKRHAQSALRYEVKMGRIIAPTKCSLCGCTPLPRRNGVRGIEAHHPDYNKPFEVLWLCSICHGKEHRNG